MSIGRLGLTRIIAWMIAGAILVFLFAPVILVVLFSFNSGTGTTFPIEGLSTRWYRQALDDPEVTDALINSAKVGVATVLLSSTVGTAAAFALSRRASRVFGAVGTLMLTPLIIPGLFIGIALLATFSKANVQLGLSTILVGHVLVTMPFVVIIVGARLARLDRAMMEAARDLGAGPVTAFRKVMLPVIAPALLGASLLALAWSADEFIITLFTNGGDSTAPVLIYTRLRQGLDPSVNAIASMILGTTIIATLIAGRFISTKDMMR
jgi:spermidine/putrescine transport system permease protein